MKHKYALTKTSKLKITERKLNTVAFYVVFAIILETSYPKLLN